MRRAKLWVAVLGAGWIEYIIMQLPYSHCILPGIGTRERVRIAIEGDADA
jgi:hypothetical protein